MFIITDDNEAIHIQVTNKILEFFLDLVEDSVMEKYKKYIVYENLTDHLIEAVNKYIYVHYFDSPVSKKIIAELDSDLLPRDSNEYWEKNSTLRELLKSIIDTESLSLIKKVELGGRDLIDDVLKGVDIIINLTDTWKEDARKA